MLIDMQVAHRLDLYVDEGMAGKLLQHMVKKTDAGRNLIFARAVEVEFDIDRRFRRLAMNISAAHAAPYSGRIIPCNNVGDRKRVVWGKRVTVRVSLGGGRTIKKKKKKYKHE